jgi:hypothetical protein
LFTASLSVPDQVSYKVTKFPVTINAEYTFKQPISGTATVTISKNTGAFSKNISCSDKQTTFYVDIVKDLGYTDSTQYYYSTISLVFVDPKTNTKATDQKQVGIVPFSNTLQLINSPTYKPGQNLAFTLAAKTLEGKPAPNLKVSVVISGVKQNLITGSDGTVKGSFKTNSSSADYLQISAECPTCQTGYSYSNPLGVRPAQGISLTLITEK